MSFVKTPEQLNWMRHAGKILQEVQVLLKKNIKEGVTLLELDTLAEKHILEAGAIPAFKNYQGFPATLCTMINSEIVHGIPDERALKDGDLLSVDCGVIWKGFHADAAFTVIVGGDDKNPARAKFSETVYLALQAGCRAAKSGNTVQDIGRAIQPIIENAGYSLCKEYTGHGIGTELWEDPHVFNFPNKNEKNLVLKEGMTLAIEPIVAMKSPQNKTLSDGWTVVTVDGKDACQWEHFGVVTKNGLDIFA